MYDLNLIPIHFHQGQLKTDLPGFLAAGPPRRTGRGRGEDLLLLHLKLGGSLQVSSQTRGDWLKRLIQIFFRTSGSVTAAMRTVVETLNLTMMEKNLKSVQGGGALTGEINLAVVHRQFLYVAQCGLTHAFVINRQGWSHFCDPSMADRGLGLSRTPTIRYFQTELAGGAYLVLSSDPPENWDEASLYRSAFPTLEQLRRRLMNQAPPNLQAGVVEIEPGTGRINLVRPILRKAEGENARVESPSAARQTTRSQARPPQPVEDMRVRDMLSEEDREAPLEPQAELQAQPPTRETARPEAGAAPESPVRRAGERDHADAPIRPEPMRPTSREEGASEKLSAARQALEERSRAFREKGLTGLAAFFQWWHRIWGRVGKFLQDLWARWSPGEGGGLPGLSKGTLLFIAVAVPLMVVTVAVGVYLARGKDQQYQYYYDQAFTAAQSALAAESASEARSGWAQTLVLLEEAESYRDTEELEALRAQAQEALDLLDGATRLEYHPAIVGSLYSGINVDRIVSFGADLYLFDSMGGRVIHALRTGSGYEVDPDFTCMAGQYNGVYVDELVDMVALPINNLYQAHVLGVDGRGNLLYCSSGDTPVAEALPDPMGSEGQIKRMAYNGGFLYVLDPVANMILVYKAESGQFLQLPQDYFEGVAVEERPDLSAIEDLAANGPELYLLRADGYLASCVSSGIPGDPVDCADPAAYVDSRPGKEDQPVIMPESRYDSLLYTAPPDPSLYLLEAVNGDIYRFSVRLKLYERFRPDLGNYEILSPEATAFSVGIDRIAFLAFGHQVFYAYVE